MIFIIAKGQIYILKTYFTVKCLISVQNYWLFYQKYAKINLLNNETLPVFGKKQLEKDYLELYYSLEKKTKIHFLGF